MKSQNSKGINTPEQITLIESIRPNRVGKKYFINQSGGLVKKSIGAIVEGRAGTVDVSTADSLAGVINKVGDSDNLVLCPASFNGAPKEGSFTFLSTAELVKRTGLSEEAIPNKVFSHDGELYVTRKKKSLNGSAWVLFDADNPEGIPPSWRELDIQARLEMWDKILPGISKCERVEAKSSSARVICGTDVSPAEHRHSHAWIRVTNPERLEILNAYLGVAIVNQDLYFNSPRRSKEVI